MSEDDRVYMRADAVDELFDDLDGVVDDAKDSALDRAMTLMDLASVAGELDDDEAVAFFVEKAVNVVDDAFPE
jgi:hypothetical protein